MKIAFVLTSCRNLGPFIVAREIINNISDRVDSINIYYLKESGEKLSFNAHKKKVGLRTRIDFSKYDIIHSHGFLGDLYTFLNRKSIRGKWITTIHQKIKPDYSMIYGSIVGRLLEFIWVKLVSKSSCIVCLTEEMAVYYKKKSSAKIIKIYNGISSKPTGLPIPKLEKTTIEELRTKFIVMGISASLIQRKGIDRVIQAMHLPSAQNLALIILGDGSEKPKLIQIANDLNLSERVLFLGFKPNAIDYFRYFDLYMMSSRSEGFGLCVLEAASQKIPVVCNDLSVFRELFSEDEVVRFNLDDLKSIATGVNKAISKKNVLSELIYKKYTQAFSAEIMAENYLSVYKELN
jgi:glycosyltransferase involved in cell wall biosynthesis